MRFIDEFKTFIRRGNVVDLAVAVIIGAAFGKIVTSLVSDILMPPIGVVVGQVDFKDLGVTLQKEHFKKDDKGDVEKGKDGKQPAAKLDLDADQELVQIENQGKFPGTYVRLAMDQRAKFGYKPVAYDSWGYPNASRYVRMFQARRSLLVWKIFGERLDGFSNDDHPSEFPVGSGKMVHKGQEVDAAKFKSRYDLDYLLWQAARQAGVCARSSCDARSVEGDGPFEVDTSTGKVEASAVIVAAGRWSRFRPRIAVPSGLKWVGLKAHYREKSPAHSTDLYFFDHGYCGVQPVSTGVVNACAMVRSDRATSLDEVFALQPALAERSRDWHPLTEPVTTAPLIYRTPEPVRGNLIFVGDAAAFIDPFVGDGISLALRTGHLAAMELQPAFKHSIALSAAVANYQKEYERQFIPLITAVSRIRPLVSWP